MRSVRVDPAGAAEVIARHREVTCLCHVQPDADAIGSTVALATTLFAVGRTVHATFDPGLVPAGLAGIPGASRIVRLDSVPAHDGLVVVLDCASPDRAGGVDRLVAAAGEILVVDHHRSNPGFGTHLLLDPDAASTASLLLEVFSAAGLALTPDVATALYAGLVTDTGSFRWGGQGIHHTAAALLAAGADAGRMAYELLDAHDPTWPAVKAGILATVRVEDGAAGGRGVAWLAADHAHVQNASVGDVESLVDEVRGLRGTSVSVVLKEWEPGVWAVSLRSRDGVDIGSVAVALGGGGHAAAAGCTLTGALADVESRVRDALG